MSTTSVLLISILAAAIPTLAYVSFIYWIDRYEKEPIWLLASAFLWGAIPSILIAFIFNTVLSIPFYLFASEATADVLAGSLIAPPVEESVKGLVLLIILFRWRHEIDSILDGIIYGAMVGLGFAMVENVYYFINVYNEGGVEAWQFNIFLRAIIFGLNHALFTSITGLGIAIARLSPKRWIQIVAPVFGWMMAMFLHFVHNLSVSFGNLFCVVALISGWGGVWLTLTIMIWALWQEHQWLKTYLAEEIALGNLTHEQYAIAISAWARMQYRLNILFDRGFRTFLLAGRFYYHCSELAYKKHHFSMFTDDKSARFIAQLRKQMAAIRPNL